MALLAYFDFPGLELGDYKEVRRPPPLAISVHPRAVGPVGRKTQGRRIEPHIVNGDSAYFPGPTETRFGTALVPAQ